MDNFRKLVYKTPELQTTDKQKSSNEVFEYSEKIAKEKLTKILNPEFCQFGIRMMNIGEYKEMLRNNQVRVGSEFYLEGWLSDGPSIQEYIKRNSRDWASTAKEQTRWNHSHHNINTFSILSKILESFYKKNTDKKEALEKFRDYIINVIPDVPKTGHELNNVAFLVEYAKHGPGYTNIKENDIGIENIKIVKNFLENENFLTDDKDNLRNLVNALSYQGYGRGERQQYHIALILDEKIAKDEKGEVTHTWGHNDWVVVKQQSDKGAESVLGAISIMPNKELYQEMIELEKDSGDFAHPIFDSIGIVRWPREK